MVDNINTQVYKEERKGQLKQKCSSKSIAVQQGVLCVNKVWETLG